MALVLFPRSEFQRKNDIEKEALLRPAYEFMGVGKGETESLGGKGNDLKAVMEKEDALLQNVRSRKKERGCGEAKG